MKNSSTLRWTGTVILFVILYLLYEAVLFWLFDGDFKLFRFGGGSGLNTGSSPTYINDIKYFFISYPYNSVLGYLAAALGLGVLISLIIIFCLSHYITGKVFSTKNKMMVHRLQRNSKTLQR